MTKSDMKANHGAARVETAPQKIMLAAARGIMTPSVPFWLMRQAGRYLPEYRALREKSGGFLRMIYDPEIATEITMQPLRRFGMDAAILFSDILVIPQAMGQQVEFTAGEGPRLEPVRDIAALDRLRFDDDRLSSVYAAISLIRAQMEKEKFYDAALIGFAGAPWTVATYMVEGVGSKDFSHVKKWAYGDPESFSKLIDLVTQATIIYLKCQIASGAEIVQLFDSWAAALDENGYKRWVIEPARQIVAVLRDAYPAVPVICFPKGSGFFYRDFITGTDTDVIGLDWQVKGDEAAALQKLKPVQGCLDPARLLAGGTALEEGAENILRTLGAAPLIFNLGHGVIKETPPEHVEKLATIIRGFRR